MDFFEGLARVPKGENYGFINQSGRMVIDEKYDLHSGDFSEAISPRFVFKGNVVISIKQNGNQSKI